MAYELIKAAESTGGNEPDCVYMENLRNFALRFAYEVFCFAHKYCENLTFVEGKEPLIRYLPSFFAQKLMNLCRACQDIGVVIPNRNIRFFNKSRRDIEDVLHCRDEAEWVLRLLTTLELERCVNELQEQIDYIIKTTAESNVSADMSGILSEIENELQSLIKRSSIPYSKHRIEKIKKIRQLSCYINYFRDYEPCFEYHTTRAESFLKNNPNFELYPLEESIEDINSNDSKYHEFEEYIKYYQSMFLTADAFKRLCKEEKNYLIFCVPRTADKDDDIEKIIENRGGCYCSSLNKISVKPGKEPPVCVKPDTGGSVFGKNIKENDVIYYGCANSEKEARETARNLTCPLFLHESNRYFTGFYDYYYDIPSYFVSSSNEKLSNTCFKVFPNKYAIEIDKGP